MQTGVQNLIDRELLLEAYAPEDRRVKYVSLSAELRERLERYLDFAYEQLRKI